MPVPTFARPFRRSFRSLIGARVGAMALLAGAAAWADGDYTVFRRGRRP